MIRDKWRESGNKYERFEELLKILDIRTRIQAVNTADLGLYSVVKHDDKTTTMAVYDRDSNDKNPKYVRLQHAKVYAKGGTEELMDELDQSTKLMITDGSQYLFTSASLSRDLAAAASLGGDGMYEPTPERSAFIVSRYQRHPTNVKIIIRQFGNISKVFAMRTEKYAYIPQTSLCEVISQFPEDLGKWEVEHWEVDHFWTRIWITFPDVAEDMDKIYHLPDTLIPGILIETSDTGDCSFTATEFWTCRTAKSYGHRYLRKHSGVVKIDDVIANMSKNVFSKYTQLPERMSELLEIDIPDPAGIISEILNSANAKDYFGKRELKKLEEALKLEIVAGIPYTAYDIAMLFLTLPERYVSTKTVVKHNLEEFSFKVPFVDFKELTEEPVVALVS